VFRTTYSLIYSLLTPLVVDVFDVLRECTNIAHLLTYSLTHPITYSPRCWCLLLRESTNVTQWVIFLKHFTRFNFISRIWTLKSIKKERFLKFCAKISFCRNLSEKLSIYDKKLRVYDKKLSIY